MVCRKGLRAWIKIGIGQYMLVLVETEPIFTTYWAWFCSAKKFPKYWPRSCSDKSSSKYRSCRPKYRFLPIFENIILEGQKSLLSLFIPPSHFPKWLNIRKKILLSCRGRETQNRERAPSLCLFMFIGKIQVVDH